MLPGCSGGYLLDCRPDYKLVMERQCNMASRWFVGLHIGSKVWVEDKGYHGVRLQEAPA